VDHRIVSIRQEVSLENPLDDSGTRVIAVGCLSGTGEATARVVGGLGERLCADGGGRVAS